MSAASLRDAFRSFTTGCALITTDGPRGPNVMAAEWTFNVSYDPFLILVSIDPGNLTHDLILEAKEFGVNLVSEHQVAGMAFAGHYSKADTDKLSSELFETYPGQRIHAPLIRGSLLAAECRLVEAIPLGDHVGVLGEVIEFSVDPDARPVVLHRGSRHLGERIVREPAVAVAATPMEVPRGSDLTIAGELTGPARAAADVEIELRGPDDQVRTQAQASSSSEGHFHAVLGIPSQLPPGSYRVLARARGAEGHARVRIR